MVFARRETFWLLLGDLLLLAFSLWLALFFRSLEVPAVTLYLVHLKDFLVIFGISILVFFISGMYEKQTRFVKSIMLSRVFGAQLANTVIAAILFFLLPFAIAPKTILLMYLIISVALISLWRFFAVPYFSVSTRQQALLVAGGPAAKELYEEMRNHPKYYIQFMGHSDPDTSQPGDIARAVESAVESGVRLIVLDTLDERVRADLVNLYDAMLVGVSFSEFSTLYEGVFDRIPIDHIDHGWLLECLPKGHAGYDFAKWFFDVVLATIGIIIAAVFVVPAVLVLMATGGKPFFLSERIGKDGKSIRLIKLRTMLFSDHGDLELQKKNRVTRVGWFLRKTRIDELPQLVNVLRGELSFIGPRPELPNIAKTYQEEIPFYEARHLITPGLSGWAQIHDYDAPRGPADIERTRRKLSYDLFYLKRRSFVLDIVIALKTLRALAAFSGS